MPCRVSQTIRGNPWMPTNIDVFWQQLVLVISSSLFSGAVILSVLYYRQNKRKKTVDADKTVAETREVEAKTDVLTVAALGDAIEFLRKENQHLSNRQGELQAKLDQVADYLVSVRTILLDFHKGLLILTHQVVEAHLEPGYTIPREFTEFLKIQTPFKRTGKGESGG